MDEPVANPPMKPSDTTLTLIIMFDQATGEIGVQGPIGNKFVCYGMLESAKDIIRANVEKQMKPKLSILGGRV